MATSAKGKDKVLEQVMQDDSDEWEYEYSTTETETYYLAVELSHPEFKGPNKVARPSRGRYHKQWHEPASSRTANAKESKKGKERETRDDDDRTMMDADQDEEQAETHEEDDTNIDPQLRDTTKHPVQRTQAMDKGKGKGRDKDVSEEDEPNPNQEEDADGELTFDTTDPAILNEIQILDLHSQHPIISYRGKVFQGDWAEVIGTDMILGHHDEKAPIPVLRHLAENVDLLGASSSRILTKEVIPRRKDVEHDELAEVRERLNIKIPTGRDKKSEKVQQARFLENLMAIKRMQGHQDEVTVYATPNAELGFDDEDYEASTKSGRAKTAGAGRGSRQSQPLSSSSVRFADGLRNRGVGRARGRGRGRGRGGQHLLDELSGRPREIPESQRPANDSDAMEE